MNDVALQQAGEEVIPKEHRVYFRNCFHAARHVANQDAEGFQEILFAVERFGSYVSKQILDLGKYQKYIESKVSKSPLFSLVPDKRRAFHLPFTVLYDLVRNARNDALHQGAYARHLTSHAIQLALIIEDALREENEMVSDFMVHNVVSAKLWQPVSFIRQQMLANSFSYLPVKTPDGWKMISDAAIVEYLRIDRKSRLAKKLEEAIEVGLALENACVCDASDNVDEIVTRFSAKPIVVIHKDEGYLLGIVTPFDLL